MRIGHFQAIADILLGDAETLARGYHEIISRTGPNFETDDARRRCAIAVGAVGMAVDPARYHAACAQLGAAPAPERVEPACNRCGSTEIVRDALASWNNLAQQWEINDVYDSTSCQSCEAESDDLCRWQAWTPDAG